jgi:spoIIIJ-associated protein
MSQRSNKFEFEGKTVKDAIELALQKLSVAKEDVDIKILCEEKRGLFGMEGEKPAKIQVYLKKEKK